MQITTVYALQFTRLHASDETGGARSRSIRLKDELLLLPRSVSSASAKYALLRGVAAGGSRVLPLSSSLASRVSITTRGFARALYDQEPISTAKRLLGAYGLLV